MQIVVTRDMRSALSTQSEISVNGKYSMWGLEPPNPIPAGEYEVWLRWSAKNGCWVLAVMNVEGHTDIEVHPGNRPEDTKDCLLPGITREGEMVLGSRDAFQVLLDAVKACVPNERVTIKYVNQLGGNGHVKSNNT